MKWLLFPLLLVISLSGSLASAAPPAGPVVITGGSYGLLWQVHGNGGVAHVLARIHVMDRSVYPIHPRLKDAFDRSEVLALEMNLSDPEHTKEAQRAYHDAGTYHGDSLASHVSAPTYRAVQDALRFLKVDPRELDHARPWLAAEVLREAVLRTSDFDPKLILDLPFMKMAQGKHDVVELLPMDEQLPLFKGYAEASLEATATDVPVRASELYRLEAAWKSSDLALYKSILAEADERHPAAAVAGRQLNARLAKVAVDRLSDLLASGKTAFVILDGELLVSDGGVLDQLRALGCAVEPE